MDDRIIIVDDDPDYADVLRRYLNAEGYENLHLIYEPLKAAEIFEQGESFELAFIDLNMPEMDGATLLDVIKSNSPTTACIIVTAVNDLKMAVECIRKGAYEYLLKPVFVRGNIRQVTRNIIIQFDVFIFDKWPKYRDHHINNCMDIYRCKLQ